MSIKCPSRKIAVPTAGYDQIASLRWMVGGLTCSARGAGDVAAAQAQGLFDGFAPHHRQWPDARHRVGIVGATVGLRAGRARSLGRRHRGGMPLRHGQFAAVAVVQGQHLCDLPHQQHQTDQKLAEKDREGYTLVLAMRSWEFEAFTSLRR